jgi:predicted ATPase
MSSKFRLVYLWVEQYKNIDDKGIHFTLDYELIRNERTQEISLAKTPFGQLCDDGNNPLKLLDAYTALIGENGSGKSNLIELISFIYTTGKFPSEIDEFGKSSFCIIEDQSNNSFFLISRNSDDYAERYKKSINIEFLTELSVLNECGKTILYHPLNDLAAGTSSTVAFNSVKIESNPFTKLLSGVSDSGLAKRFSENTNKLSELKSLKHVIKDEYTRFLFLFSDFKNKLVSDKDLIEEFSVFSKSTYYAELYNLFLDEINNKQASKNQFLLAYMLIITISSVQDNIKSTKVPHLVALMIVCELFVDEIESFKLFEQRIRKYLIKEGWDKLQVGVREHYDHMKFSLGYFDFKYNELNGSHLVITFSNLEVNPAIDFICSDDWFDIGEQKRLFRGAGLPIKIEGLSSGEISIIHFLNELKSALQDSSGSTLVILDEPENSFHPEWQRNLISILNEICQQINLSPQIIISSHSPFVLSDILEGKALLLRRKSVPQDKSNKHKKFFAANIHNMLDDSFFLESTIGEAAKTKITEVISFINEPEKESLLGETIGQRIKSAQLIIDHVGDQLLSKELTKRLNKIITDNTLNPNDLASLFYKSENNPDLQNELRELSSKYNVITEGS